MLAVIVIVNTERRLNILKIIETISDPLIDDITNKSTPVVDPPEYFIITSVKQPNGGAREF